MLDTCRHPVCVFGLPPMSEKHNYLLQHAIMQTALQNGYLKKKSVDVSAMRAINSCSVKALTG